jgi:hypothetical protein
VTAANALKCANRTPQSPKERYFCRKINNRFLITAESISWLQLSTHFSLSPNAEVLYFNHPKFMAGLNGCWDYGPLGVELLRNVKEAW